jgi:hypothetical protein
LIAGDVDWSLKPPVSGAAGLTSCGFVLHWFALWVTPPGEAALLQSAPLATMLPLETLFVTDAFVSGSRSQAHRYDGDAVLYCALFRICMSTMSASVKMPA